MTIDRDIQRDISRDIQRGFEGHDTGLTLSITSDSAVNAPFTATFTFSDDVTGFVLGDISVINGAASAFATVSARIYTATITPTVEGAVTIDVAQDAAIDAESLGNAPAQRVVSYDLTDPGLVITALPSFVNGPFVATFTFDEAVTGFAAGDIVVGNGTAGTVSGSGAVYTSTITPTTDGAVTIDVAAAVCTDIAGNDNTIALQVSTTADLIAPTCVITGMVADFNAAFVATFTFSESVTGFVVGDITVGNGAASSFGGSGAVYTATITPTAQGTVTIDVAADVAIDAASNGNTAATQVSGTFDSVQPTVSFSGVPASITDDPFTATMTFSESVTGFVVGDIVAGNATLSSFSGSGAAYTVSVQGTATGTITLDIAAGVASDAAGNTNTIATQATCSYTGTSASSSAKTFIDTYASATDGFAAFFAKDGTDQPSIYISDAGTPANDFDALIGDDLGAASALFTYTAPSPKNLLQADGYVKYSAHNLVEQSNTFDTGWSAAGTGAITTGESDPDGGANAWLFTCTADGDRKLTSNTVTTADGHNYTTAVKAKYVAGNGFFRLYNDSAAVYYDLQLGTITNTTAGATGAITDLGDGWYLCEHFKTVDVNEVMWIELTDDGTSSSVADNGDQILIYQAQYYKSPGDGTYLETTTAARYALPIEYDTSGDALGILVEPAATNLFTYSQQFDNAAWTKFNSTISADATTSPDGTTNADKLIASSGVATHYIQQNITSVDTEDYSFSVYAKSAGEDWLRLAAHNNSFTTPNNVWFDLANGLVGTESAGYTGTIVAVGDGWYRCTWHGTATGSSGNPVYITVEGSDGTTSFNGNGTDGIFIWQADMCQETVESSSIITVASTVTRAKDVIDIPTTAFPWADGAAGTLYGSVIWKTPEASAFIIEVEKDSDEYIRIGTNSGGTTFQSSVSDTTVQANAFTGTLAADTVHKVAMAFDTNDVEVVVDGTDTDTDTSVTLPTGLTSMQIGFRDNGDLGQANGHIRAFVYIPERLSNTDLVSITT